MVLRQGRLGALGPEVLGGRFPEVTTVSAFWREAGGVEFTITHGCSGEGTNMVSSYFGEYVSLAWPEI